MKCKVIIAACIILSACGAGAGKSPASDSPNATQNIINTGGSGVTASGNKTGSALIASNDCLTCHKINEKSVGPSYQQIADKYETNEGNIENLANRIIKGATGLWGNNKMTPHPNLSQADAREMAKYVLSLRNPSDSTK